MQNYSIHTHSIEYDGKNTICDMIQRAKILNWSLLGISNHLVCHKNMPLFHKMFYSDFNKAKDFYKKTLDEIKNEAIKQNFTVLVGFEVDFFTSNNWRKSFEKLHTELQTDYLIGATHSLMNKDESKIYQLYDYTRPKYPEKEFIDSYWKNIQESIRSQYFNIIAHLDLLKIFNLDSEEYNDKKIEIAELLSQYNIATELNTGGYNKYKTFYPDINLLKELNKNNVSLIISDDAHSCDELGQYFSVAEDILDKLQYKNRLNIHTLNLKKHV